MKNINHIITPETPIQSFEIPTIPPPTPRLNVFKYLFIVSIFVLSIVIISFYFILNKNKNTSHIILTTVPTETITQITPTITPTNTPKNNISYKAFSVQDDQNSISKLVLIDQNLKEIIIQQDPYLDGNFGLPLKPSYKDFVFSSDYKFLSYFYNSGWDFSTSVLYDIKNNKKIDLSFPADTLGFTPDSKYFYACAQSGMISGGAVIKQLPQLKNVFSAFKDKNYFCKYDQNNKEIILFEYDNFDKETAQYKFSESLGSILKIK